MNEHAEWIWIDKESRPNTWVCFRKKIYQKKSPESAVIKIAVDSKYWLYVNGELVIFEGGIKRGPSINGTYYDELELSEYIKEGENTIAILVWYFGKNGFSHLSSGLGGLLFSADIDGDIIVSDKSWLAMEHPAYIEAEKNDIPPNFRLAEANIYFDAAKDIGAWYECEYDDVEWSNAVALCKAGYGVWGNLSRRIIPQFKNYGMCAYDNSADYQEFTTNQDTVLVMKLPYNAQITPYFKITADADKRIVIKTDTYDTYEDALDQKNNMAVYYTKDGEQEYESLGWINGEYVYYHIPKGVTVHELKYRETGYDTEFLGSFECDDEFLNKLWKKSLRTLYVTMRDTFMDCPDRERVQWWGDVNVEMQMLMYSLDEKALLLYKKGIKSLAGWFDGYGYMLTVVPSGNQIFELPFQNLAGIWGFSYYYQYTGDIETIMTAYPMAKQYVLSYCIGDNGLVEHKTGSWDWADWGENADIEPMENAWYYMALKSCISMAELLGESADAAIFSERINSISENYNRVFLKDCYYYNSTSNGMPDDRANALAVISGLAEMNNGILNVLTTTENSSPYMEKYVLDALCEGKCIDKALERMKRRYREMVEYDYSTLWELWDTGGTRNHAWSGGPMITMSKYIAGVRPLSAGYESFEIKPYMGQLKYIKCVVPSIKGLIKVEIKKNSGHIDMNVIIPKNTSAKVYLPLPNGAVITDNTNSYVIEGEYAEFMLDAGDYCLRAVYD